jgi:LacI family transcriptional regulator
MEPSGNVPSDDRPSPPRRLTPRGGAAPAPDGRRGAGTRRATIRDVANMAGVSLSTVSRVVNGRQVDTLMEARVRDAIAMLGYRTNVSARSLRRTARGSASVGLVFEDVANPFFSGVHRGVEDVLRTRGMLTFAGSSDEEPERERELAEAFAARGVEALIIAPAAPDQSYLARDRDAGLALVFVDRPPRFLDADWVMGDNFGGAFAACEHMVARGHRRIAFLGDRPEIHTSAERFRGYRGGLARHSIPEDPRLIRHGLFRALDAYDTTRELMLGPEPPTALFTGQNLITIEAVSALHDLGRQRDVALVGFDDVTLANVVEPALTVVQQDPVALGRAAAELLLERLDGGVSSSRHLVLPLQLVERGSGEIPAWT